MVFIDGFVQIKNEEITIVVQKPLCPHKTVIVVVIR
jgi:hypothetical protein